MAVTLPAASLAPGASFAEFCAHHLGREMPGHLLDPLVEQYVSQSLPMCTEPCSRPPDRWVLPPEHGSRSLILLTKKLFNFYFRHDLYGPNRSKDFLVLSSGSLHEPTFGLAPALKRCLYIALDRDWYGYSDSRGRFNARHAVARWENHRLGVDTYTEDSVAITLGGTFGVSCLADFLVAKLPPGHAICATPNYPPLVESIARKMPVRLVHSPNTGATTSIGAVTSAISHDTRIVLLQSVTNPTGLPVSESELDDLIRALGPQTYLILDEAHECFGEPRTLSKLRGSPKVIRVASMSKQLAIPGMKVGWFLAADSLVDDFYEYASTIYGGPASFFYTLVDIYASFQRLRMTDEDNSHHRELHDIGLRYDLAPADASQWYRQFQCDNDRIHNAVIEQRDRTVDRIRAEGLDVIGPQYSVNVTINNLSVYNSYGYYRRLLEDWDVSVYPSVLAFEPCDGSVRITIGRKPGELDDGVERVLAALRQIHER